ncbi:MAG TPA: hypothetical protein VFJ74_10880, partial [Gemmatimonadaceae bacterium]|nr:hypothetical protein [Gemmatimonadaceae bacterium]
MAISSGEALQGTHHDGVAPGAWERGERRRSLRWALPAGAAIVAAALWLREPSLAYLVVCAIATAVAVVPLPAWVLDAPRARAPWPASALAATAALAAFCGAAAASQWTLAELTPGGSEPRVGAYAARARGRAAAALDETLRRDADALRARATRALDAPPDASGAFAHLGALVKRGSEEGVVLYRGGVPAAWAGRIRVEPDTTVANGFAVPSNEFYVVLEATATRGASRAVAMSLVHAEPPANRLARPLDLAVAERAGVHGFDFSTAAPTAPADSAGRVVFAPQGVPLLVATPLVYQQGEARLHAVESGQSRAAPLLAIAVVCLIGALWRRPSSLARRLFALGVATAAVGVVPLNAFSNASRLFDPSFYFVPIGGPFTASIAALGLTSAIALLALLAVLRAPLPVPSRWAALVIVIVIAGVGPFLLRRLAGGIYPPPSGVSIALWLAWEITVCLAATSVLLAGASAGRAVLGSRRGIPPWVAPALAAGAALAAPVLWSAPGRWPIWYPLLWVAAIGALALARHRRGFVLTAATVAGFGAATLVWGVTARKRVELAERDVNGLTVVDPYARSLLERFAAQLGADDAPVSRADLLRSYVTSDLAAAGYPAALTAWKPGGAEEAELATGAVVRREADVAAMVDSVRRSGAPAIRESPGAPGIELLLAVPHPDGRVTTALVAPRTRLIPDDPYAALLGLDVSEAAEPPYTLALLESNGRDDAAVAASRGSRWKREGNELHGDWIVGTGAGRTRAHVEVELRSLDALVQRGALVVLVDLAVVATLWTLAALGDGGVARWLRRRIRGWGRSYRARLTGVLFGFFIVPALAFV